MPTSVSGTGYDLVDELMPEGFDWENLVRTYPIPALLLAGIGGFLLGRQRGPAVLRALSLFAAAEVSKNVNVILGQEIL
ncbi:MAG TPA: hypothetical protein VOA87_22730 [Thermoanaerobaculia bacterium]|nr:hypothetical protein [Thermoanaerobaculia bacterium]